MRSALRSSRFAIAPLLTCLETYSDADFDAAWMNLTQPELKSRRTILIRDLTANIKGKAIPYGTASLHAGYLNTIDVRDQVTYATKVFANHLKYDQVIEA